MVVVGLDMYLHGVDCNMAEYYSVAEHYRLGCKWVGLEDECLSGMGWLDEEDLVDSKGQLSLRLPSSSLRY